MKMQNLFTLICLAAFPFISPFAQQFQSRSITTSLPKNIDPRQQYLFYFHGGVVTVLGNNAINQSVPEWGPYEYLNILDSLRARGFNVISENRKEAIDDSVYVNKLVMQVDSLLSHNVKPHHILVIGASAGWNIVLHASSKLRNKKLRFVIMGGCWPDTYKAYSTLELRGHFLSIIETTDPHGTCIDIFKERKSLSSFQEIKLNTGLSHGFIYKGHKEWIDPIMKWFNKHKP
jgi:hypothetical protein